MEGIIFDEKSQTIQSMVEVETSLVFHFTPVKFVKFVRNILI